MNAVVASPENLLIGMRDAASQLNAALDSERHALTDPKAQTLAKSTEIKRQCLEALESMELARRQWCESQGVAAEARLMAGVLDKTFGREHRASTAWKQVCHLLAEAEQKNRVNGAVLVVRQRFATETLALMSGRRVGDTYTAGGALAQDAQSAVRIPA